MRTTSFLSKRQLSPRPVLAAFSLTLSSRVSFTFLRSLSRSEARAESSNVVFAQMNQAARAYPFPSCRRQSFFIRFNGSVLFLYPARRTQEFATWINDEARESDAHMLAPGGPPTRRDLASDTFPPPIFRSRSTPCISPLSVPFGHFHLFPFSPYRRLSLARTHNPVSHCPHLSINAFVRSLISRVRVPFSLTAQAMRASPPGHRPAKVNVARRPFHPKTVVRPNPKLRLFWVRYQTHELNIAVFS